jgi:hypothetical protein
MLSDIYDWFIEGFDIADLKNAKVLLDEFERIKCAARSAHGKSRRTKVLWGVRCALNPRCASCGAENEPTEKFCSECGIALGALIEPVSTKARSRLPAQHLTSESRKTEE